MPSPKPLRSIAAALLCALAIPARPIATVGDAPPAVYHGSKATVLGPMELVAEGPVDAIDAAPTGRYALITHAPGERRQGPLDIDGPERGPSRLSLHDARSRRTTTVWRAETATPNASMHVAGWFAGTAVALVMESPANPAEGTWLRRLNCAAGTLSPVLHKDASPLFAPGRPRALLQFDEGPLLVVGAKGEQRSISVPDGAAPTEWIDEGDRFRVVRVRKMPDRTRKTERWIVDARTGTATPEPDGAKPPAPAPEAPKENTLTLVAERVRIEPDGRKPLALWLIAPPGPGARPVPAAEPMARALVAIEHSGASELLADHSGVLWMHEGRLYGRALATVERAAYDALRRTLVKREAMSRAKQMGLALMMYAQDYDETLPPTARRDDLLPYVKDAGLLSAFEYTYAGPLALQRIDAPAETVLGYVGGPGGRAEVFADGHVQWRDDPRR